MDHHLDARAGQIAARQLGLVTGAQARRLGFTRHQLETRVSTGRWVRVVRDVYLLAGSPPSWRRDVLAACFAGAVGTVASFPSAGALWGLARPSPLPHVTVPTAASARLRIAKVHRADLSDLDVTRIGEIPVTRVARTLVDLSAIWSPAAIEAAVDTALDAELVTPAQLDAAIERAPRGWRRPGVPALCEALEAWTGPIQPESPAEARLVRRLAEWGLPEPVLQHVVRHPAGGFVARLDIAWPEHRVALEYDGVRSHGPRRIEHDEARTEALEALGWEVVHADRVDLRSGQLRLRARLSARLRRSAA
jgi:very-short-patch-repair endonuclease